MFKKLKEKRDRAAIKSAFSEYMPEQDRELKVNMQGRENFSSKEKHLLLFLIQVDDEIIDDLPILLSEFLDFVVFSGGTVEQSVSNLFVVYFSPAGNSEKEINEGMKGLAEKFLLKFGNRIRLVYCYAEIREFTLGLYHHEVAKHSEKMLADLLKLQFGGEKKFE